MNTHNQMRDKAIDVIRGALAITWPCMAMTLMCGWAYHAGYERGVTQTKAAIFDVIDRIADKTASQ